MLINVKRLLIISILFTNFVLFFNCDNSTGLGPVFEPKIGEFSNFGDPPYFDISAQYIYAALGWQGLWKRPLEADNEAWEYVAFYDSTKKTTVSGVTVDGEDILISRGIESIWRSLDGGVTWIESDSGLYADIGDYFDVLHVTRSPHDKTIIAAQLDPALFISYNGGESWEKSYGTSGTVSTWWPPTWGIRWHPQVASELIYKFTARGYLMENWGENVKTIINIDDIFGFNEMNAIESIAFHQSNPDSMIMATRGELAKTGDAGKTWTEFTLPDSFKFTPHIREVPDKPGYYILRKSNLNQHLVYTTDNFKTFKTYRVTADPETRIYHWTDEFHFYSGKLYLSTNKGIESIPISEFE